jgi:hypothetical protein
MLSCSFQYAYVHAPRNAMLELCTQNLKNSNRQAYARPARHIIHYILSERSTGCPSGPYPHLINIQLSCARKPFGALTLGLISLLVL